MLDVFTRKWWKQMYIIRLYGKFEMLFPPFKKGIVLSLEAYFIKKNHFQESTLRFKGVIFLLLKNYFLKINACVSEAAELFHMKRRSMLLTCFKTIRWSNKNAVSLWNKSQTASLLLASFRETASRPVRNRLVGSTSLAVKVMEWTKWPRTGRPLVNLDLVGEETFVSLGFSKINGKGN